MSLNWLDLAIGAILLASGIAALRNGITREIVRLVALAVGVAGALWFYDEAAVRLTFIENPALARFAAFGGIFIGCVVAGSVLAWLLDKFWGVAGLRWFDRLLGGGFGLLRGWVAATVLLLGLIAFVPIAGVERAVAESNLAPAVLHGAKAATFLAPSSLREAYRENFERVREVWSADRSEPSPEPELQAPETKASPTR